MPMKIAFELSDADLEHLRAVLRAAQAKARGQDEAMILEAASRLARNTAERKFPAFVRERLTTLEDLIRMLRDRDWRMEGEHRARVLDALAYFANPADLIPDQIPGLGFLDDAIMVELVVQELRTELDAYADFCRFREEQGRLAELHPELRQKRLESRRRAMFERIERRRARRERRGGLLFGTRYP